MAGVPPAGVAAEPEGVPLVHLPSVGGGWAAAGGGGSGGDGDGGVVDGGGGGAAATAASEEEDERLAAWTRSAYSVNEVRGKW